MLTHTTSHRPSAGAATTLIHEAVLAAADRCPTAVALVDADAVTITYAQLARRVDALARAIDSASPAGTAVAVHSHKTPATMIAMLAALRAGRAYVPLDPSAPAERRQYITEQAGCTLLLTDDPSIASGAALPWLDTAADYEPSTGWTPPKVALDDIAYILYTSGSTGRPKGVIITHRNAAAFVGWAARTLPLHPGDQVALHAPLHFDVPVYDMYVGLAAGATVHPIPERTALFPQALLDFLTGRRISHLYAVPSALTALVHRSSVRPAALPDLRQILYAGEEFQPKPLAMLMAAAPGATVSNLYGPIETNVVTYWRLDGPPDPDRRIPLGHPIDNVRLMLRADDATVSQTGPAEGEILVAGDCVTPGYLHQPELTERATLMVDLDGVEHRCYRTGDFARRDDHGVLHILGRRDFMIKTRGYRVELGDVEAAIGVHPQVADVAVVAVPDPQLTHRLHAVVVAADPDGAADSLAAEVLAHCRRRLPAYMVPGRVHVLADLPRTATGKIGRRQLTDLVIARTEQGR